MTTAFRAITMIVISMAIFSCSKTATDDVQVPPIIKPIPLPENNDADKIAIRVKAVIGIGELRYDSIPATVQLTSWDDEGLSHSRLVQLDAGTDTIQLPALHQRYELVLQKWGITDRVQFTRQEIKQDETITLGGNRAAKKLKMEETFLFVEGRYRPDGKAIYTYQANGKLQQADYFQKIPQYSDLQLRISDRYLYTGGLLQKIVRRNEAGLQVGSTEFWYDAQQKTKSIRNKIYDQETTAAVTYQYNGHPVIMIDYLFSNGQAMTYTLQLQGGNKISDRASTSTGGAEGGQYTYDMQINPYAHMNMPDLYFSKISKNNMIGQQKGYGGNIPSAVPYKFEYQYDQDGYPVVLIKTFKSFVSGQDLYTTKTVYTY